MTPRTQAEILGNNFVITVTVEERRQFLQWVRDYCNSLELGRPGVRDAGYYQLRDKPWSFIRPDYEIERPDGSRKAVLWSKWTKDTAPQMAAMALSSMRFSMALVIDTSAARRGIPSGGRVKSTGGRARLGFPLQHLPSPPDLDLYARMRLYAGLLQHLFSEISCSSPGSPSALAR